MGSLAERLSVLEMVGKVLGVVKKSSFWSIREETFEEKPSTCFRMYRRKASLDQRPMIMIVYVGTLARYMAMAAPDLRECVPMSSAVKPRVSLPMALTVDLSVFRMDVDEI